MSTRGRNKDPIPVAATTPIATGVAAGVPHPPMRAARLVRWSTSAAGRRLERATGLRHACSRELADPAAEAVPSESVDVVEVGHALGWHVVVLRSEFELGGEVSSCPGERRNDDSPDPLGDRVPCQHEYGTVAPW